MNYLNLYYNKDTEKFIQACQIMKYQIAKIQITIIWP